MAECINWREFSKIETCHLIWDKLKRKVSHLKWDGGRIIFSKRVQKRSVSSSVGRREYLIAFYAYHSLWFTILYLQAMRLLFACFS